MPSLQHFNEFHILFELIHISPNDISNNLVIVFVVLPADCSRRISASKFYKLEIYINYVFKTENNYY